MEIETEIAYRRSSRAWRSPFLRFCVTARKSPLRNSQRVPRGTQLFHYHRRSRGVSASPVPSTPDFETIHSTEIDYQSSAIGSYIETNVI